MCEENRAAMRWIWSQCDSELGKSLLQLFHCIRAISFTSLGEAFTFLWDPCCITSCPATETDMVWAVSLNPLCSQLHSNVGKRQTQKQLPEQLLGSTGVWVQEKYNFMYENMHDVTVYLSVWQTSIWWNTMWYTGKDQAVTLAETMY